MHSHEDNMRPIDYATDERYTVPYIEREAALILLTLGRKCVNKFGRSSYIRTELDKRILHRWGLDR